MELLGPSGGHAHQRRRQPLEVQLSGDGLLGPHHGERVELLDRLRLGVEGLKGREGNPLGPLRLQLPDLSQGAAAG